MCGRKRGAFTEWRVDGHGGRNSGRCLATGRLPGFFGRWPQNDASIAERLSLGAEASTLHAPFPVCWQCMLARDGSGWLGMAIRRKPAAARKSAARPAERPPPAALRCRCRRSSPTHGSRASAESIRGTSARARSAGTQALLFLLKLCPQRGGRGASCLAP